MKKFFLAIACLLAASVIASAQVDYAAFEARGAFVVNQGKPGVSADFLNIQVKGHIGPSLRFRFRHRLTKPVYDANNPLNGTDILSLTWDISPKWSISGGKLPIFIGGYEWDDAPIDVYYYSGFCNGIQQVYGLGGSAFFRPKEGQELEVQVTHSPLHGGNLSRFNVGLCWSGRFCPWWETKWSINWIDDYYHHMMGYVALGNRIQMGSVVALELDLMYRRALTQKKAQLDGTVIAKMDFRINDKWRLFVKGSYDENDQNVDDEGIPYDMTLPAGSYYWVAGGGVEFFPLGNSDLRIHAVAWTESATKKVSASVGLTYYFDFVKIINKYHKRKAS